jgi:UDP:flavonoid glycosyltransferase YjiC (YdhE family)
MARHPDIYSVWIRRPMWQDSNRKFLALSDRFDAVIEPGELAEELDHGPTRAFRHQVHRVPPILMLSPAERLSRAEARSELDLPEDATVVAVQLGSGANFDMEPVRRGVTQALLRDPSVIVLDLRSPVAPTRPPPAPAGPRHRTAALFPVFRYSLGFDAAVSAPGYNTFHESVLGGIPTLFVPNEAEEMDQQLSRAQWAEQSGMGLLLRRGDPSAAAERMVEQLLDRATRQRMMERCGEIAWADGALAAARLIEKNVLRAE